MKVTEETLDSVIGQYNLVVIARPFSGWIAGELHFESLRTLPEGIRKLAVEADVTPLIQATTALEAVQKWVDHHLEDEES